MTAAAEGPDLEQERLARAALSRAVRPGALTVHDSVHRHGAVRVWEGLRATFPEIDPRRDLDLIGDLGGRLVIPGDPEWPAGLADCDGAVDPSIAGRCPSPFALWVLGARSLATDCARAVAVVGSRAATGYGSHVAGELALDLVGRGVTVVSGAAYGIDGAAHRGALAGGGQTIAVVAGGVDVSYPAGHQRLLQQVAAQGAVVSEVAPGGVPGRVRFLSRNRIIAAISQGTVMVEAGLRSGARNTVAHARALGRPRMMVPGPITSALSLGCHLELRTDPEARLVTSAEQILEEIEPLGEFLSGWVGAAAGADARTSARDSLGVAAREVLDVLPVHRPGSPVRIAAQAGVSAGAILGLLAELVAAGLAEAHQGGFRAVTPPR